MNNHFYFYENKILKMLSRSPWKQDDVNFLSGLPLAPCSLLEKTMDFIMAVSCSVQLNLVKGF